MKTINKLFELMINDKKVRLTQEGRKFFDIENLGQWFSILSVNYDNTANLCGKYHTILKNTDIEFIKY